MSASVVVCIHVSRGRRPGLDLSIHNAQELTEEDLRGMFPNLEAMLRHGLRQLKSDESLVGLPDGKDVAEVMQ